MPDRDAGPRRKVTIREPEEWFDHSRIGMALQALDGRYVRVNPAFCELLGYTEADLLAMDAGTVLHAEDREADAVAMRELFAGVRGVDQRERRYVHQLGHVVWAAGPATHREAVHRGGVGPETPRGAGRPATRTDEVRPSI